MTIFVKRFVQLFQMAREIPVDPAHLDRRAAVAPDLGFAIDEIVEIFEALPDLDRAVVECLIWGGMTKVEVSKMLGISRSYVHKIWRRAREDLRTKLSDDN